MKIKDIRRITVFFLLGLFIAFFISGEYISSYKHKQREVYLDSIKTYRDALGREIAERNVIVGDWKDLSAENAALSEEVRKLGAMLDKNTVSATIVEVSTVDTLEIPIDRIIFNDSLPTYTYKRSSEWDTFDIEAGPDTLIMNYSVRNEYQVEQTIDKNLFKADQIDIVIKNMNPNSYTTGLVSYHIPMKKNKFFLGVSIGAGAVATVWLWQSL